MGNITPPPPKAAKTPHFGRGGPVVFVAGAEAIAALRAAPDLASLGEIVCHAITAGAPVEQAWLSGAGVLVIEVSADQPGSLERLDLVRRQHPELPVVVALAAASISLSRTLLRQGINDVVTLPFDCAALVRQLRDLSDGEFEPRSGRLAPVVLFAGSTGGCGTTTILTHLAAELVRGGDKSPRICVIDLDLQAGEVAYYLGQVPRVTVAALIAAGDRLDAEMIRSALTDSQHGFSIIAAPETVTALDDVDQGRLLEMIGLVRSMFDIVLIDVPTDWSNWALSLTLLADPLVLVTELSVAGLRQAKRRLDLFASIGVRPERIKVLANRVEHGLFRPIGLKDAAQVLGCEIAAAITDADDSLVSAQNEGRLLTDIRSHGRFVSEISHLAQALELEGR